MVYKLYYFNGRGRAELSRLALAAAGQKYDDIRIEGAEWPKVKTTMPQGSMPVLEVNGQKICQSMAIARFIAREFGMYGKDNMEMARVDVVLETTVDFWSTVYKTVFEKDAVKKAEFHKKLEEEDLPGTIKKLEDILDQNGGGNAFMVGPSLTVADLTVFNLVDNLQRMSFKIGETDTQIKGIDKSQKLLGLAKRVSDLPRIASYLKTRPDTQF